MNFRVNAIASLAALAAATLFAGSAGAVTVAGWDFSQYLGDNLLTIDGSTGADTLSANYSNLDLTGGAGLDSAVFGTMYINGSFGSSTVDPFGAAPQFVPTVENLGANINAPFNGPGSSSFDNYGLLASEGQAFTNPLGMTAAAPVDVVFGATIGSTPGTASDWGLSFAARTSGGVGAIAVEFSLNGLDYTSYGVVNIDGNDTAYNISFGDFDSDQIYVRLLLNGPGTGGAGRTIIDNVSANASTVPVPEPTAAMLVLVGLSAAVVSSARRRS